MSSLQELPALPGDALSHRLADGGHLVTVNNRLAHHLRGTYEREQRRNQRVVWQNPVILPWSAFVTDLYTDWLDRDSGVPRLLNPVQETALWLRVVQDSAAGQVLMRPLAAVDNAIAAMQLVYQWQLPRDALARSEHIEPRCFARWLDVLEHRLAQRQALVTAQLPALLRDAVAQRALRLPGTLILAGFESPTPVQEDLVDALLAQGVDLYRLAPPQVTSCTRRLVAAHDADDEIDLIGTWAAATLRRDPNARLGVVVPDLGGARRRLDDGLATWLQPERSFAAAPDPDPVYEFSLGEPLDASPLVSDALAVLGLAVESPATARLTSLLVSPFIGGADAEFSARAALGRRLREDGRPLVDRRRLLARCSTTGAPGAVPCPDLHGRLAAIDRLAQRQPRRQHPSAWTRVWTEVLRLFGWPGARVLDHAEFQQRERCERLLAQFASLDDVESELGASDALTLLRQLAGRTTFQPQNRGAPVQVLGLREAQDQVFDHVWVMGLDADAWPPAPNHNPLLPLALQRACGIPQATAAGQLGAATRAMERLATAAPDLTWSWSRWDGERERRPSPLLANEAPQVAERGQRPPNPRPHWHRQVDDRVPPPEAGTGGAALLADQSACPFRAVVHHRLHAREVLEPGIGIEPWRIGNLLHRCLEVLWRRLQDQETLRALPAAERDALVLPVLDDELARLRRDRPDVLNAALETAERERLHRLLTDWLAQEAERSPGFRIAALETELQIDLDGLPLRLRLDRVDRLSDGRHLVIDYKYSRNPSLRGWTEARLREPQLPLYAVSGDTPVAGAALACLRGPKAGFHGYGAGDDLPAGIRAPDQGWAALTDLWRAGLGSLAREILDGRAEVSPTDPKLSCRYCDLHAVCRIREHAPAPGTDGND